MRREAIHLACAAALLLVPALAASPAAAAVYCVAPASGCAGGSFADLPSALAQAQVNAGPDEVRLGATTYSTATGFRYADGGSSTNSLTLAGAGRGATTLTRTTGGGILILSGNARNTVGDLRFHLVRGDSSSGSLGLQGGSADVIRVDVDADPAVANSEGIQVAPGSVHDVRVSMATSGGTMGFVGGGPSATDGVFDSSVVADRAIQLFAGSLMRTRVVGGQLGIQQQSGTIDDVSVRLAGSALSTGIGLLSATGLADSGGTVTARHLTIVGDGQPRSVGVAVFAAGGVFGALVEGVELRNAIVRGVASGFQRVGTPGSPASMGTANLSILYSDVAAGVSVQSGPGTGPDLSDPRNVDVDPRFVDLAAGDLRLRGGSPAIDAGDPAGLGVSEPLTDLGGDLRLVDGNGDGVARQDMGAFEYQRRAPVLTSASAAPPSAASGAPVAFAATASDPDGDPVTLAWQFDDGATAAGANVAHAFASAGAHLATVTATDSAGVQASAQVRVAIAGGGSASSGRLTGLSLAPVAFRPAAGGPSATAARKRRRASSPATGATVTFKLDASGTVDFTFQLAAGGRKVRGRCAAPRRANRGARRCPRLLAVRGSFTRTGAAGTTRFHFSGRVGGRALAPGAYRLVGSGGGVERHAAFTIKRPPRHRR